MPDPFFEIIPDGEWNACIGEQGAEENYVDGYIQAAIELASAVIDKKMYPSRDTLAMPILYNGRHGLELSLKFAINRLHRAGALQEAHKPDHDILSHWKHLRDAEIGDTAIRGLVDELEPFVVSLASVDDDGQELRYAKTQGGKKSLDKYAVVNLPHIRASLEAMGAVLTRLKYRVEDLEEERSTGSHTRECSRLDLREIAKELGNHSTWKDASFAEKKEAIRARFGLSSKKFSQAVDKIKASRELGALIGLEQPLHHISDEKAVQVLELWANANPVKRYDPRDLGTEYMSRDFEKMRQRLERRQSLNKAVSAILSLDELADFETLFYVGRGPEQGEHYEEVLQTMKDSHKGASLAAEVDHIMTKTSLLENVIAGAGLVGRPSLARKLRAVQ